MIKLEDYKLKGIDEYILKELISWRYENPYDIYDLYKNEYLNNYISWGMEQFVLAKDKDIIAYVSCQIINNDMWVGWSLRPDLCGNKLSSSFLRKCIDELMIINNYQRDIFLKVYSWNKRAIKAYENIGFLHHDDFKRYEDDEYKEYIIMKK